MNANEDPDFLEFKKGLKNAMRQIPSINCGCCPINETALELVAEQYALEHEDGEGDSEQRIQRILDECPLGEVYTSLELAMRKKGWS